MSYAEFNANEYKEMTKTLLETINKTIDYLKNRKNRLLNRFLAEAVKKYNQKWYVRWHLTGKVNKSSFTKDVLWILKYKVNGPYQDLTFNIEKLDELYGKIFTIHALCSRMIKDGIPQKGTKSVHLTGEDAKNIELFIKYYKKLYEKYKLERVKWLY